MNQLVADLRAMMDDLPIGPRSLIHFHWAVPPDALPRRQWMTNGSVILWCPHWLFYRLPRDKPPGARYAMDADLTLYWPWVRPCWQEVRKP